MEDAEGPCLQLVLIGKQSYPLAGQGDRGGTFRIPRKGPRKEEEEILRV